MSAVMLMAFMLSAICFLIITPEVAAEEDDDVPTVFIIEERGHNPDMRHEPEKVNQTIRIIGEFEMASERMNRQEPGPITYVDYPGMGDMSPMERNLVKDMAHLAGFTGVFEGDIPRYNSVIIDIEQHDIDTIGTHDSGFISKAMEYFETEPEYNDVAEVLEQIVMYNQSNIEDLGREISCADTRASGDQDDEAESDEDICVVDSESDNEIQHYEGSIPSDPNVFSSTVAVFVETFSVDFKL